MNIKNSAVYFTQKNILIGNFLLCSLNEEYLPFLFVANACRGNSCLLGKAQYQYADFVLGVLGHSTRNCTGTPGTDRMLISGVFLVAFVYMR